VGGLYLFLPTLGVIFVSWIVVKIASVALMMTGLDAKRAQFQALSAFTGTGFTTRDAELVVADDRRRRIIMVLMVLGNAGLVGVVATLIASATYIKSLSRLPLSLSLLVLGILILFLVTRRKRLMRRWNGWIEKRLAKSQILKERLFEEVLHLAQGYGVAEIRVQEGSPLAGKSLATAALSEKKILVLAIERSGGSILAPTGKDIVLAGDRLICYGRLAGVREIAAGAA